MCRYGGEVVDGARDGESLVGDVVEPVLLGGWERGNAFGKVGLKLLGSVGFAACW
jgi:hypothetical protein